MTKYTGSASINDNENRNRPARMLACISVFFCLAAFELKAEDEKLDGTAIHPFQNMWGNFKESFSLENTVYYHLPALASTGLLVATGWDYDIQYATQKHTTLPVGLNEAFFETGWYAPVVITGSLYGSGWLAGHETLTRAGAASAQAVMLTFAVTMAGKTLTGRRGPAKDIYPQADKTDGGSFKRSKDAADFNFAFWENFERKEGRFFWPSGHTSSMFAIAAAVTASTGNVTVGIISYSLAGYMGLAMIDGDHHWASDVTAGALLGHVIGWSVGSYFFKPVRTTGGDLKAFQVSPFTSATTNGLRASWFF